MDDIGQNLTLPPLGGITTPADADLALKTIALADAAETLWRQAKDPERMLEAIRAKLINQAAYAVWRQNVAYAGRPKLSQISDNTFLDATLPAADPGASVISRWRKRLCEAEKLDGRTVWHMDEAKLDAAFKDAALRCVRIVEQENMGTIRGTEGTGEFERYTPAAYIDRAREVMTCIDLDPCSSAYAQETVDAAEFFTAEDDGLTRDWFGHVWMNPPYHRVLAPQFIKKLVSELRSGRVTEAIVLTNNSTDTEWFRVAADVCDVICFTEGRIRFEVPNADPVLPTQGQAFFYFGPNDLAFITEFQHVGLCVRPVRRDA